MQRPLDQPTPPHAPKPTDSNPWAPAPNEALGVAPADARPHPRWSRPKIAFAYLFLFALALLSIWFINRRVDAVANLPLP